MRTGVLSGRKGGAYGLCAVDAGTGGTGDPVHTAGDAASAGSADVHAADGIPDRYPEIGIWYIGGHSLGGSMAAACAEKHGDLFEGLVLLASYSTKNLTDSDLRVLSVYGTEDGVLNRENYSESRGNLPETTVEAVLDGGNHACFGSYGSQEGDGAARISPQEQMKKTAALLLAFFEESERAS